MTFDEWYEAQQVPYGHEHYEAMKAAWLAARAIDLRGHLAGATHRDHGHEGVHNISGPAGKECEPAWPCPMTDAEFVGLIQFDQENPRPSTSE